VNKTAKITNGKKSGEKAIMTCDEVAEFLRVHVSSVRRWSRGGKLRAYKVGGRGDWRYRKQDVLAFLYDTSYADSKGQGQREVIGMIKA
jgi:excisionase family DNA binding protein